jgi:hypothetical protein
MAEKKLYYSLLLKIKLYMLIGQNLMKKDKEDPDLPAIHLNHKNIKQFNATSFSNCNYG